MRQSIDVQRRSNLSKRSNVSPIRVGPSEMTIDELHKTQQDNEVQAFSAASFNDVKIGSEANVRRNLFPSYKQIRLNQSSGKLVSHRSKSRSRRTTPNRHAVRCSAAISPIKQVSFSQSAKPRKKKRIQSAGHHRMTKKKRGAQLLAYDQTPNTRATIGLSSSGVGFESQSGIYETS